MAWIAGISVMNTAKLAIVSVETMTTVMSPLGLAWKAANRIRTVVPVKHLMMTQVR